MLTPAKCTNCGANLEYKENNTFKCPHCASCYFLENNKNNDFVIVAGELKKYKGSSVDVVIPEGITIIGRGAFSSCCGLRRVVIPNGVERIGYEAFSGCHNLEEVVIPESVEIIGQNAFAFCRKLKRIELPKNLKCISDYMFWQSGLSEIDIPFGVTHIYGSAFKYCELSTIQIPETVKEIGNDAFSNCKNLSIANIPGGVKEISSGVFKGCNLTEINIPYGITYIGNNAFAECKLSDVVIPDTVTQIESGAFDCPNITITIPDSATSCYDIFGYNRDTVKCINASEKWKTANWNIASCLLKYKPKDADKSKKKKFWGF